MNSKEISNLYRIAERLGIEFDDVYSFRRDSMTLRSWFERECGDSNNYASWAVERDPDTDIPYLVTHPYNGKARKARILDREKGARKRIDERCKRLNLHYYIQTDCRGLALYLSREPLTSSDYSSKGIGVG
jgi:hypothetical protein